MSTRYLMSSASTGLAVIGGVLAVAGLIAAVISGLWMQALLLAAFLAAALSRLGDPHWSATLALVSVAYARMPCRLAWGVEIPPIEALIPLPLWWEILVEQRPALQHRWVPQLGAVAAVAVAAAGPMLSRGAHWYVTAPAAATALVWLLVRDTKLGRNGAARLIAIALAPACVHVILELLTPSYPARELAPLVNAWMATIALLVGIGSLKRRSRWTATS